MLEKLAVSLETAKKLKEAGFPQETVLKWWKPVLNVAESDVVSIPIYLATSYEWDCEDKMIAAAPTFNEIWGLLPDFIYQDTWHHYKALEALPEATPTVSYGKATDPKGYILRGDGDTIQEAAAQMWLKFKEEGLV